LSLEVGDSIEFVSSLEKRLASIEESLVTKKTLGEVNLSHCPQCLTPIEEQVSEHVCSLCKSPLSPEDENLQAIRMRQELSQQIKESNRILEKKTSNLDRVRSDIPKLNHHVNTLGKDLQLKLKTVDTSRNQELNSLYSRKGSLESSISFLHKQAKATQVIKRLENAKEQLSLEIAELENDIKMAQMGQRSRAGEAATKIEGYTLAMLKSDLHQDGKTPLEEAFDLADNVHLDFRKNTFSINDRNQFSASSMTYLRNAVHFAVFFASLDLKFFRYPRLIICDNIEDKGMQEQRSQNFQKLLVEMSSEAQTNHQIIFTTSMIDPELDKTGLCVGPYYTANHKSLDFVE